MFESFLQGLGVISLVTIAYCGAIRGSSARWLNFVVGSCFAAGLLLTMAFPVAPEPGLVFDLRNVFLVLAASYGGVPAALISTGAAGAMRVWVGGVGMQAGLLSILVASALGYVISTAVPGTVVTLRKLILLGGASIAPLLCLFVLPWNLALHILGQVGPSAIAGNVIGVVVTSLLLCHQNRLALRERILRDHAARDPLTGLLNRRSLEVDAAAAERSLRDGGCCGFILVDIDHFKSVNDTFGHQAGDEVLKRIADQIQKQTRSGDFVARYGGEEIVIVMPDADDVQARRVAERIREGVQSHAYNFRGLAIRITVSAGIYMASEPALDIAEALRRADEALYVAKKQGRNQVQSWRHAA